MANPIQVTPKIKGNSSEGFGKHIRESQSERKSHRGYEQIKKSASRITIKKV